MNQARGWTGPGQHTVLLIEPDEGVSAAVTAVLDTGVRVLRARSGDEALDLLARSEPGIVLMALELPDMDGLTLCRHIRASAASPVVFVAGSDEASEALVSYAAGADGYVSKPYRLRELDARIRAGLRRAPAPAASTDGAVAVGDVALDVERHEVRVRGRIVRLPLREFELLRVLMTRPGRTWRREALIRTIWGETPASGTKSLDVHIRRIRGRIEDDPARPRRILTVRSVGYQYARPAVERPTPRRPADGGHLEQLPARGQPAYTTDQVPADLQFQKKQV